MIRFNDSPADGPEPFLVHATPEYFAAVREELISLAHNAFRDGYTRAVGQQFAAIAPHAEEYLRLQPGSSEEHRRLIYGFVEHLQKRLAEAAQESGYVDGGLGI